MNNLCNICNENSGKNFFLYHGERTGTKLIRYENGVATWKVTYKINGKLSKNICAKCLRGLHKKEIRVGLLYLILFLIILYIMIIGYSKTFGGDIEWVYKPEFLVEVNNVLIAGVNILFTFIEIILIFGICLQLFLGKDHAGYSYVKYRIWEYYGFKNPEKVDKGKSESNVEMWTEESYKKLKYDENSLLS